MNSIVQGIRAFRLFGGEKIAPSELLEEADGLAELLGEDEEPQFALSHKSQRLRDLTAASREMRPEFYGSVAHCERYGSYVQQARAYRLVAVILAVALLAQGGVIGWLASQLSETKVVPYVVRVDKHGYPVAVGAAERDALGAPRQVMASLGRWAIAFRTRIADRHLQDAFVREAFMFVGAKSVAAQKMFESYEEQRTEADVPPRNVSVEIARIAPRPEKDTYVVEWHEDVAEENGHAGSRSLFSAVVTVVLRETQKRDEIVLNPSGVFIKDFSVSKLQ